MKNMLLSKKHVNLFLRRRTYGYVIFLALAFHISVIKAQDTALHIYTDSNVYKLVQQRMDYARLTQGVFSGYRIQINFGQDRGEANKTVTSFVAKYPAIKAYLTYEQPYFKVNVGDFRTKLEAVKKLKKIRRDYPGAFVVRDKINPPPAKQPTTVTK